MVGCGSAVLIFLLAAAIVGSAVSSHPERFRAVLASVFDYVAKDILSHADSSVTAADRREFGEAYSRFRSAWLAGRIDSRGFGQLRRRLMSEMQKEHFRHEDLGSLVRFFEDLASGPAPARSPSSRAA